MANFNRSVKKFTSDVICLVIPCIRCGGCNDFPDPDGGNAHRSAAAFARHCIRMADAQRLHACSISIGG